jgi:hypothetical protein
MEINFNGIVGGGNPRCSGGRDRQRVHREVAPFGVGFPVTPECDPGLAVKRLHVLPPGADLERCAVDKLRRNLVTYVESELESLVTDGAENTKPTAGFHRLFQRAVIESSSREEVTGADVLAAILAEREARAA